MRRGHLVLFARQPRLGRVKRRLAAGVGAVAALRFYRLTLDALLRRVGGDRRWTVWLAVTPDTALRPAGWPRAASRVRRVPQGRGDLGRRMARALRAPPPGPVVLVGSDIPAVAASHIAAAFRALGRHAYVFGPAEDGGFWLVGARRVAALPAGLFDGARWSTGRALADSLATLPRRAPVGMVDRLADVDDAVSLTRWRAACRARGDRALTKT